LPYNNQSESPTPPAAAWSKFLFGIFCLIAVVFFFTRGVTPPGVFGDVIRHNRAAAIDATPLFYSEVENIVEIQAGLAEWWDRADTSVAGTMTVPSTAQDSTHAAGTDELPE